MTKQLGQTVVLVFGCLASLCDNVLSLSTKCSSHTTYDGCPESCSQTAERFSGDSVFNCSIGRKEEVTRFINQLGGKWQGDKFAPPDLIGIASYWIAEGNVGPLFALEITFMLPKAYFNTTKKEFEYPRAVILNFTSVKGQGQDDFYRDCPRERIFIFHKYQPPYRHDAVNPRNITYRCLYGLAKIEHSYGYLISLGTAEGGFTTYAFTVPVRYQSSKHWRPVIATRLNEVARSIDVIIEKTPSSFATHVYEVELCDHDNICTTTRMDGDVRNSTTFSELSGGIYKVKAAPLVCGNDFTCPKEVSYGVDGSILPIITIEHPQVSKTVTMLIGSLTGVLLLTLMAFFLRYKALRRAKAKKLLEGIVIYSPYGDSPNTDPMIPVVEQFCVFLSSHAECQFTPCYPSDNEAVNGDKVLHGKTVALIICARQNIVCNTFETLLADLLNRRDTQNNIFIYTLTFSFIPHSFIPDMLKRFQKFEMMKDLCPLYQGVHPVDMEPSGFFERYANTKEGQALHHAISDAEKRICLESETANNQKQRKTAISDPFKQLDSFNDNASTVISSTDKSVYNTRKQNYAPLVLEMKPLAPKARNFEKEEPIFSISCETLEEKEARCTQYVYKQNKQRETELKDNQNARLNKSILIQHQNMLRGNVVGPPNGETRELLRQDAAKSERHLLKGIKEGPRQKDKTNILQFMDSFNTKDSDDECDSLILEQPHANHDKRSDNLHFQRTEIDYSDETTPLCYYDGKEENSHVQNLRSLYSNLHTYKCVGTPHHIDYSTTSPHHIDYSATPSHHMPLYHIDDSATPRTLAHNLCLNQQTVFGHPHSDRDVYCGDKLHSHPAGNGYVSNQGCDTHMHNLTFETIDNYNPKFGPHSNHGGPTECVRTSRRSISMPYSLHEFGSESDWIPPSDVGCSEPTREELGSSGDTIDRLYEINLRSDA